MSTVVNSTEAMHQVVDDIVARVGRRKQDVIPILQDIQKTYHYLPEEALQRVCEITDIAPDTLTGVATFYAQFRHKPAGKHMVKVCVGTACHVKGADTLDDTLKSHLNIPEGQDTDPDMEFTVEKVGCLGCCMIAPVIQADEQIYGLVETRKIPSLISEIRHADDQRDKEAQNDFEPSRAIGEIRICLCSSCVAGGSKDVFEEVRSDLASLKLPAQVRAVGCSGESFSAPLVEVVLYNDETYKYGKVAPQDVRQILLAHFRPAGFFKRTQAVFYRFLEHLLTDEAWDPPIRFASDLRQDASVPHDPGIDAVRVVTEHAGYMSPDSLEDYRAHGGFEMLEAWLGKREPIDLVDEIFESGLRGRGGAGFSTGMKWRFAQKAPGPEKYVVCNGDEGDPGAFMDRMILESFPYRVIEGMLLAGYAIGAHEGFFYIRAEYPLAVSRIRGALEVCREAGLIGERILGTDFSFQIHISIGAGAFVCGEETALLEAIEGNRGMPRYRPPYPAQSGLWGKPTLINNVETLASISWILRNGASALKSIGTEQSCGTKTFALAGKINRGGLIEVPMGITINQIVEQHGGGVADGRPLKAVMIGGPSGGCVPAHLCDTPVDFEALREIGSMMGSGGLVVLDDHDCMVDIARYFMDFLKDESCGKCTHCRIGTRRMADILDRLCHGKGTKSDLKKLEELADLTVEGSLCGLGTTAPNPLLTTMRWFKEEYEAHVNGHCPAGKCKDLIAYRIFDECIGCTRCAQYCPVEAIPADPYHRHVIDLETCIRCDVCYQVCPTDAVKVGAL